MGSGHKAAQVSAYQPHVLVKSCCTWYVNGKSYLYIAYLHGDCKLGCWTIQLLECLLQCWIVGCSSCHYAQTVEL